MRTQIQPSVKLLSMSSSKIESLSCERYYFWMWIMNLVPRKINIPLWFGTIMHAAFEAMTNPKLHKKMNSIIDKASKAELAKHALVSGDSSEIQLQLEIAKKMAAVYLDEYSHEIIQLNDIQTEIPFETRLSESPVMYEGTIDTYGKKKSDIILIERKTARTINNILFALLKFDIQINGYAHALKHALLNKYPKQCYYTAFRKPQIRVNKNESVDAFLIRLEEDLHKRKDWYYVPFKHNFGIRSITEVMTDIERTTADLYLKYKRLTTKQLLDPYNWPRRRSHCLWYGACPYIVLCKNCSKYPLYLKLFQPRELRYKREYSELLKAPLKIQTSTLKHNNKTRK